MLTHDLLASDVPARSTATQAMSVLLVEPDPELRDSRYLLLSCLRIPVLTVGSYAEVFQLLEPTCYSLIVLSIRSNERQASHVAEYMRRRWPTAKILLLGDTCGYLDDPLYDERVNACGNPSGVVKAAERLLESIQTGRIIR
jgi:hypothetical protein